ncbi:hypothetical protein, partial [Paraburkholderia sp. SIMBA_054]|uniref:hypothetical protein n=1 Tax=Paraburkholderia sp. SIMBA_054 TaxID=3085795 RepID=UPI00397BD4B0
RGTMLAHNRHLLLQRIDVRFSGSTSLFFAAAKKSRCRPAQGRRVNGQHRNADASAKHKQTTQRRRQNQNPNPKKEKAAQRTASSR